MEAVGLFAMINRFPIFYGWYVVLLAFLCRFMSAGVGFYIFNAFMKPLCESRGWRGSPRGRVQRAGPLTKQTAAGASGCSWRTPGSPATPP